MDDAELQAKVDALIWFHSMQLRPGVATSGPKRIDLLASEAEAILGPLPLAGLSVLDVGAWNGFFSFEAKRRGAARVMATDSFTWQHPDYRGRETIELAREVLEVDVELHQIDVMDMGGAFGRFDVVLFLGVFYHLLEPVRALALMREMTGRTLVVETHQDALAEARPAMIFYPNDTLDLDPTNWWGPNPSLMYHALTGLGFRQVLYRAHPMGGSAPRWWPHKRGIYHAHLDPVADLAAQGYGPEWSDMADPDQRLRYMDGAGR